MIALIQGALLIFQLVCAGGIAYLLNQSSGQSTVSVHWLVSIVLGLLIAFMFQFALIGLDFILSRIHQGKHPSTPPSFGAILKAWLRESIDCIRVFSYLQVFTASKAYPQPTQTSNAKQPLPVLLIHGYFCNRGMWHRLAAQLAKRGHWVEGVSLEPVWGSIDSYPKIIERAARQLMAQSKQSQVVLIGHSMGGLAIRSYLRHCAQNDGSAHVAHAITLGTPHQGTWLSRLGHGLNVKQMGRQSAWLAHIAQFEEKTPPSITAVVSDLDNIVFPQCDQTIPSAQTVLISGMGHVSMAFDDGVDQIIFNRLAQL